MASKLVEETEDNDDDVFVVPDLIDTGQNLPLAIASFVKWLTAPSDYRQKKHIYSVENFKNLTHNTII